VAGVIVYAWLVPRVTSVDPAGEMLPFGPAEAEIAY
jgi:hypothetical protein